MFNTKIAGVSFEGRQDLIKRLDMLGELDPGTPLVLRKERDNPFDSEAVGVYTMDDEKLGFVPRQIANTMQQDIYDGEVLAVTGGGRYNYGVNIKVY